MLRLLADENLHSAITTGLLRRLPDLDIFTAQQVELTGEDDPRILEFAASEGRLLVTHDVQTMPNHVAERLALGLRVPGVILAPDSLAAGDIIEDLMLIVQCSVEGEWEGQIIRLPL
jgi:hypothetical protein